MNRKLTYQEVIENLNYDRKTGIFTFRKCYFRSLIGAKAGSVSKRGYVTITVLANVCRAHQLAWLYVYGEYPASGIDHIDGNRSNNAIANLRITSPGENSQNIHKAYSTNRSGFLGAHYNKLKGKYKPRICINGKRISLGTFKTAEEAHKAYMAAKRLYHPYSHAAQQMDIKESA